MLTGASFGAAITVQEAYDLSIDWYADRARETWTPFTAPQAQAIFAKHGLTGPFWRIT